MKRQAAVIPVAARLAPLMVALAFAGCAAITRPPAPSKPPDGNDVHFEVDGRFAVRYRDEGGSGRIAWLHLPQSDEITISNPVGQGIARIVRRDGVYTLTTSQGREHSATDPDQLTEPLLGWPLPLSGLPFWLRGQPAPGRPSESAGVNAERPTELRQSGWTIEYLSRHSPNGLPERLRIRRDDLDIRLVLEEWRAVQ
ncbi:MAG: lipoprotein insertase outer membrane protein LolB [Burkholderiales bacterium]